jgi:arylsulfatase
MYKDGWWACTRLDKAPWDFSPETISRFAPGVYDPEKDVWELYYLPDDFSQAATWPRSTRTSSPSSRELWWAEAERNRALPLLGGMSIFFGLLPPLPAITRYTFAGDVRSYAIEAELEVPESGAESVIVANADFIGGFGLWVDSTGMLHHTYLLPRRGNCKQTSTEKIPRARCRTPSWSPSPATPAWTSAATTAWSSTAPTKTKPPIPSPEP